MTAFTPVAAAFVVISQQPRASMLSLLIERKLNYIFLKEADIIIKKKIESFIGCLILTWCLAMRPA